MAANYCKDDSKSTKYCIVPKCTNTTRNTPNKRFFCVPKREETRNDWCRKMGYNQKLSSVSTLYCCSDHFNLEEDTANLSEYQIMNVMQRKQVALRLKRGVMPHKFECQNQDKKEPEDLEIYSTRKKEYNYVKIKPKPAKFMSDTSEMKKDTINYMKYKMGFSQRILLTDEAVPTKFHCQEDRKRRLSDAVYTRKVFLKRQRIDLVTQCLQSQNVTETHVDSLLKENDMAQVIIEPEELSKTQEEETVTNPTITVEKSVHVTTKIKPTAIEPKKLPIAILENTKKLKRSSRKRLPNILKKGKAKRSKKNKQCDSSEVQQPQINSNNDIENNLGMYYCKINESRVPSPYPSTDIPEVRQLILRVYRYLNEEYEQLKVLNGNSSDLTPLADILKRTAAATGVSEHTVTAILDEDEETEDADECCDEPTAKWKREFEADGDISQREQEYSDEGPDDEQDLNDYILKTMKIELEEDWVVPPDIGTSKLTKTDPLNSTPAQSPVENTACTSSTVKTEPDPDPLSIPSPELNTLVTVKCELGYHLVDHQYTKCSSLAYITSQHNTLTTVKSEPEDDEMRVRSDAVSDVTGGDAASEVTGGNGIVARATRLNCVIVNIIYCVL